MMTSLCTEYYQFMLAQGILGGMASGVLFAPVMACVGQYFQRRRAAALWSGSDRLLHRGYNLSPLALSRMIGDESLGFGWSVRIAGFIILAMMLIGMITLQERLALRARATFFLPAAFRHPPYVLAVSGIFLMILAFHPILFLPQYAAAAKA